MKQTINGRTYDTVTARHLGGVDNDFRRDNWNYLSVDLYRTRDGLLFFTLTGGSISWGRYIGQGGPKLTTTLVPISAAWGDEIMDCLCDKRHYARQGALCIARDLAEYFIIHGDTIPAPLY